MERYRFLAKIPIALKGIAILVCFAFIASMLVTATVPNSASWGLVPSSRDLLNSGKRLFIDGIIYPNILASTLRVVAGFLLAYGLALSIAILLVRSRSLRVVILPINAFVRYVPPTAYVVLLIGLFGVSESYKISVVFFGVFFFLVIMIVDVFDNIDQRYLDMARLDRANQLTMLGKVLLPWSLPQLIGVAKINIGAAWTFLVVSEMVGANSGLGYLVVVSQRFSQVADVYWIIAVFGMIGWAFDAGLNYVARRVAPWHSAVTRRQ